MDKEEPKVRFSVLITISLIPIVCLCGLCLYKVIHAADTLKQANHAKTDTYNMKHLIELLRYVQMEQGFGNSFVLSGGDPYERHSLDQEREGADEIIAELDFDHIHIPMEEINTREKLQQLLKTHREKVDNVEIEIQENIAFYLPIQKALLYGAETAMEVPEHSGLLWRKVGAAVVLARASQTFGPRVATARTVLFQCNYTTAEFIRFNFLEGASWLLALSSTGYDDTFIRNYTRLSEESGYRDLWLEYKHWFEKNDFITFCQNYTKAERWDFDFPWFKADRVHYFLMRDMLRDFVESLVIDLDAVILKSENEILIYIVVFILAALLSLLVSILITRNIRNLVLKCKGFAKSEQRAEKKMAAAKHRENELLYKLLPRAVAEHFLAGNKLVPRHYDSVTVCYVDLDDFLKFASRLTPSQVIDILGRVASLVDDISDEQGVLKLDFISNDTFILASGLPDETVHHCRQMAKFATKLLKEIQQFAKTGLQIKIGIHSGPVVAGVIGRQVPRFSLLGESTKVAERMCRNCPVGKILMTESARGALDATAHNFSLTDAGEANIPGLGTTSTFFLLGTKSTYVM